MLSKSIFWTQQDQYTHELKAAVFISVRPAQDQTNQHSSNKGRFDLQAVPPPLI